MPNRTPAACRRPGCGGLVVGGICSQCGVLRAQFAAAVDERRGNAAERGYDARWRRLRDAHLAREPLCRMCRHSGLVSAAALVDHIVPIADGGAVLDDDNLQSLCRGCHDKKTAVDVARRRAGRGGSNL